MHSHLMHGYMLRMHAHFAPPKRGLPVQVIVVLRAPNLWVSWALSYAAGFQVAQRRGSRNSAGEDQAWSVVVPRLESYAEQDAAA